MMVTVGVLLMFVILVWDGIVIFFLDGDLNNIYEEDWHEPEHPGFPECKHDCQLRGSDYCIYECSVFQIQKEKTDEDN